MFLSYDDGDQFHEPSQVLILMFDITSELVQMIPGSVRFHFTITDDDMSNNNSNDDDDNYNYKLETMML